MRNLAPVHSTDSHLDTYKKTHTTSSKEVKHTLLFHQDTPCPAPPPHQTLNAKNGSKKTLWFSVRSQRKLPEIVSLVSSNHVLHVQCDEHGKRVVALSKCELKAAQSSSFN